MNAPECESLFIFTCILCARFDIHTQTSMQSESMNHFRICAYINRCTFNNVELHLFLSYSDVNKRIDTRFACHIIDTNCAIQFTQSSIANRNGESINTKLRMAHVSKESAGAHNRPSEWLIANPHYRHACLRFSISENEMFNLYWHSHVPKWI